MTNQVPWLRTGTGQTPSDGGCIMQVIDWIDRNQWSDAPECVHPVIRNLAIYVNDRVDDTERQRLLDLAPRMMGTNTGDERLTRQLLGWLARQAYPLWEQWVAESGYDDQGVVLACVEAAERGGAAVAARAARAAEAAVAAWAVWAAEAAGSPSMQLLVGVLDRYDELTARTSSEPIKSWRAVCAVMAR